MVFLEKLCSAFTKAGIDYGLVGGHAVALHGAVRGTVDVDFVFKWEKETLVLAEQVLSKLGLISRLPINANDVFEFRDEYINNRNLIAWNFYHPEDASQQVDIIINYNLNVQDIVSINTAHTTISLLAKKPLIKMKRAAGRPQDLEDVVALEKLLDEVDA